MKKIISSLFLICLCSFTSVYAKSYPSLYSQFGTPLFESVKDFNHLSALASFASYQQEIKDFDKGASLLMQEGLKLDSTSDKEEIKAYLKGLRKLQSLHDKLEKLYKQQLYKSIYTEDKKTFFALLQTPLSFLSEDERLKKKVVAFYKKTGNRKSSYLKALSKDFELDEQSYAYVDQMFKTYAKEQEVAIQRKLNSFVASDNAKKKIEVMSIRVKDGFDLYCDNHTYSDVSLKLNAKNMQNLSSEYAFPYIGSYPSRSRSKILHLSINNVKKNSSFSVNYSSRLGSLNPDYDKTYVYALPYKRGKSYLLSQGFNGGITHKGISRYALDFALPEGSEVHAMRDGIVTGVENKYTKHGFSPEFASKANYIIIEHDDGSMAMYGHLRPNGVSVRLGTRVYKHQLIGYSGNTGYSSGPHLHVHISVLKNFKKGAASVPFVFLSKRGKISSPVEKTYYIAK